MEFENFSKEELVNYYNDKFKVDFSKNYKPVVCDSRMAFDKEMMLAMDDTYNYNISSNGVPGWMTLVNLNVVMEQLLIKRAYTEIGAAMQYGSFETNNAMYATVGINGQVEPYSDYSGTQESDANVTYPNRSVFRGQTKIQYGELETATMAQAKIDIVAQKQYAAAMNIAIAQNRLFFYGNVNGSGAFINQLFGLLNDPALNAAVPATNGGSSGPTWQVKSASPTGATDIANDVVVTAYNALQSQLGGNISLTDEFYLCFSTVVAGYFNTTNQFNMNPAKLVKEVMPNIKIITAPEYTTIGSFQLIAANAVAGQNVVKDLFTYKARGHGIWRSSETSFSEKWSFGSSGCAILNYAPIATISGIQ